MARAKIVTVLASLRACKLDLREGDGEDELVSITPGVADALVGIWAHDMA